MEKTKLFLTVLKFHSEAVVQRCSVKKAFLEISLKAKEHPCQGVFF